MAQELQGKKIAIVATDGFEQAELVEPKQALEQAGAQTHIISLKLGQIQGWNHFDKADYFPVDVAIDQANPQDYDGLLLPGGVANPDQLRTHESVIQFIRSFFESNKPVAAICHGPWTLIEAGAVKGRTLTSWPSLKTDLQNAGAGTPAIGEAIALGAAVDYLSSVGMDKIHAYEEELTLYLFQKLSQVPEVQLYGPLPNATASNRAALAAFTTGEVHPNDLSALLDQEGIAIRTGHHCTQPLHRVLGVNSTARASLYFYNTREEIDAFIVALRETIDFFGRMFE